MDNSLSEIIQIYLFSSKFTLFSVRIIIIATIKTKKLNYILCSVST